MFNCHHEMDPILYGNLSRTNFVTRKLCRHLACQFSDCHSKWSQFIMSFTAFMCLWLSPKCDYLTFSQQNKLGCFPGPGWPED